jgi:hypothetical protein
MKFNLFAIVAALLICLQAQAQTYPIYTGQFTNYATASCDDPRVLRGLALIDTANHPNGILEPGISYNMYMYTYPCWTLPSNITTVLKKNGVTWDGNGTLKPTDTLSEVVKYQGGSEDCSGIGNHKAEIDGLNPESNVFCLNPDGTSCGATVKVDGVAICY